MQYKPPTPAGDSIRAIIFDFGDVLTKADVTDALLARCDAKLGLAEGAMRRVLHSGAWWERASTGEISPEEYWSHVGAPHEASLPPEFQAFQQGAFVFETINEEVVAVARQLHARSRGRGSDSGRFKLALCSNAMLDLAHILEKRPDIRDLFDEIVISAQVGLRKPNPAILQLTAERLGIVVDRCLLVDDKPRNTDVALAIGMSAIVFRSAGQLVADLTARGLWDQKP